MLCPAAGCDDRFRNDLRILLRPRPACQIVPGAPYMRPLYLLTRSNRLLPSLHAGLRKSKPNIIPIYVFGDAVVISREVRPLYPM